MNTIFPRSIAHVLIAVLAIAYFSSGSSAQDTNTKPKLDRDAKQAREYALGILDEMETILKEKYYDPKFKGIDLEARLKAAKARVKTLQYNWQMYRVLVQVLMEFDDSHTRLHLPPRSDHFEYGIDWQMIGDECYVVSVDPNSNAAKQGVEVGDQLVSIGSFTPNRADLWKINYVIYRLAPERKLELKIKKADGTESKTVVEARTMTDKEFEAEQKARAKEDLDNTEPFRCKEVDKQLIACRLESFAVEKNVVDKMMKAAAPYQKMILDLRGNSGGYVVTEQYLLSHFFDREVKILDLITRSKTEERSTKVLDANRQYKGEVAVLIDSRSASASEITAKVLQLEKRAKIYGDFSSGSVMTSISVPFTSVMSALSDFAIIRVGMSVTIGDVVMRDGTRLEKHGVTPDIVLQPTREALKMKADAVLAYAAMKLGSKISVEEAGRFYFIRRKEGRNTTEESKK